MRDKALRYLSFFFVLETLEKRQNTEGGIKN